MENKSIYDQLDEINEKQDEILEAVNHRTPLNRNATVNIDLTKATNAACESIVKNAIRVWRYQGEKSDFRRETHQNTSVNLFIITVINCPVSLVTRRKKKAYHQYKYKL